jgi:hypothetical protein
VARVDKIGTFVRVKEVSQAHVCRDVPPEYARKKKRETVPDSSVRKYQKIVLVIPDEYAFALTDMYEGRGLQYAIMHLIKEHVIPKYEEKEN